MMMMMVVVVVEARKTNEIQWPDRPVGLTRLFCFFFWKHPVFQ